MRNLDKLKLILEEYDKGNIIYKDGSLYRTTILYAGKNNNGRWEKRITLQEPRLMRMNLSSGKYYRVKINNIIAYEHLVIYAIHHGIDELEKHESIDHIDINKLDNNIDNLEGVTTEENNRRIISDNLLNPPMGECNGASKVTEEEVLKIRKLYKTGDYSQYDLSDIFNITQGHISDIINRNVWKHI